MENMNVRTRFAPSPTGYLHVGGLRTALYAFLFARKNKGDFLLRIEDTDRERYVAGADIKLMNILKDFGLGWDDFNESEIKNRESRLDKGVMYQSKRLPIYKKYSEQLVAEKKAYYCFCSQERLEELRKRQTAQKLPTGYDGLCRNLNSDEINEKIKITTPVIRLKMPKTGICKFNDLVRGNVEFAYNIQEDIILMKSDGFPTYHLAHVVDDHEMKISHVIRGEEWLSSIPKHIVLWEAFGWSKPEYAHLSLIVNPDHTKLSKRQGDVAVEDYLKKGYLKEALLNFILLLGWNPGTEKEIFTLDEMIEEFTLEKINKSPAVFNIDKLDWFNGYYIRKTPIDDLVQVCKRYLQEASLIGEKTDEKYLRKVIELERERLKKLSELPELTSYFFKDLEYDKNLLIWKKQTLNDVKKNLSDLKEKINGFSSTAFSKQTLEKEILNWIKERGLTNGEVLWPLRAALTGKKASPGPFEVAEVLGKERTLERIEKALK